MSERGVVRWVAVAVVVAALALSGCGGGNGAGTGAGGGVALTSLPNSSFVFHRDGVLVGLGSGGEKIWEVKLPEGERVAARMAVAPNSTVYARSRLALHAVDHRGVLLWTAPLPEPPAGMSRELLAPVALANSWAAVLESPTRLRAFDLDGAARWSVDLTAGPAQAPLVASRGGLLVVGTPAGFTAYTGQGTVAWQHGQ